VPVAYRDPACLNYNLAATSKKSKNSGYYRLALTVSTLTANLVGARDEWTTLEISLTGNVWEKPQSNAYCPQKAGL
jgi:hypothetical protein